MKFEYWKADNGNWYWHLKAANGEVIAQGEGYVKKDGATHAISLVKASANASVVNLTPNAY